MKIVGLVLMVASAAAALFALFGYGGTINIPVLVGAAVFFVIGLVVFLGAGEFKRTERIEKEEHTDKHTS